MTDSTAPIVGLDLGTTNSVLAVDGVVQAISWENDDVNYVLPSVVAYTPSQEILVGEDAVHRRAIDSPNTIVSSKRIIGVPASSELVKKYREHYHVELVTQGNEIAFQTRGGLTTPVEVSTMITQTLKQRTNLDPSYDTATVAVPADFDETRRAATRTAVQKAGFANVSVIDEPVATAVAYLMRQPHERCVVFDLGGGTFDLAIVDCNKSDYKVLAHAGDPYLGGDDIDLEIARYVRDDVLKRTRWDLGSSPVTWGRLVYISEVAKTLLSTHGQIDIDISEVESAAPPQAGPVTVSREIVRGFARRLAQRTFHICDEVFSSAKIRPKEVDTILLAGGSVMLPGFGDDVANYFGHATRMDINPLHVVALGASYVR